MKHWLMRPQLKNGHMHAAVGTDYLELNEDGNIKYLEIKLKENIVLMIEVE
jgi:hypothetical protein